MGTKKGQVRKTARRAYEPKKTWKWIFVGKTKTVWPRRDAIYESPYQVKPMLDISRIGLKNSYEMLKRQLKYNRKK